MFGRESQCGILDSFEFAREFGLRIAILGSGHEYRRLAAVQATGRPLIVPINFPIDPESANCFPNASCRRPYEFSPLNFNTAGGFKSKHPAGANFVMADASTHFITEDIDMDTYLVLGHLSDGQVITDSPF